MFAKELQLPTFSSGDFVSVFIGAGEEQVGEERDEEPSSSISLSPKSVVRGMEITDLVEMNSLMFRFVRGPEVVSEEYFMRFVGGSADEVASQGV